MNGDTLTFAEDTHQSSVTVGAQGALGALFHSGSPTLRAKGSSVAHLESGGVASKCDKTDEACDRGISPRMPKWRNCMACYKKMGQS